MLAGLPTDWQVNEPDGYEYCERKYERTNVSWAADRLVPLNHVQQWYKFTFEHAFESGTMMITRITHG